jgi:hypothetical protein
MASDQYWLDFEDEDPQNEETQEVQSSEYSSEQEQSIKSFAQSFHEDVNVLAKQYMAQFFKDKMLYCGGKVPHKMLFAERSLSMVLNYDIIKGVEKAYEILEPTVPFAESEAAKISGDITSDIRLVNEILGLLAKSGVPQQFAGGMMILYLEFIEGF